MMTSTYLDLLPCYRTCPHDMSLSDADNENGNDDDDARDDVNDGRQKHYLDQYQGCVNGYMFAFVW
ncbi:hypothetical protein E2562_008239 [Oryza meyeriana var. granulata]|uniref:Uncharacterized protein n=1 Tax=Oryza meyeriana var. granulata TaxID=110450 RepID=A0A6G1DGN1_9ORYZ|nr:hypothetical protein E2562_008239 [Oryza meyeriana var. granulata]